VYHWHQGRLQTSEPVSLADSQPREGVWVFGCGQASLSEERFHFQAHREQRSFPGYELAVAGGGPRLKESRPDPNVLDSESGQPQREMMMVRWPFRRDRKCQPLGEDPNDFASPNPRVIDKTGLTGKYDFTLRFPYESCQFAAANSMLPGAPDRTDAPAGVPNI
jgi:uncharacterized protein (TIGR03435 family)